MIPIQSMRCVLTVPVLLVLVVSPAWAQGQPRVYASTFCFKALPGKGQEYEQFQSDLGRRLRQVLIQEKRLSGWSFSRAVTPTGEEARCSHLMAFFFEGAPPEPQNLLEADLKKAGLGMSAGEYVNRLSSLSKLILHERYVQYAGFGAGQKGDYWQLNFMKPLPGKGAEFRKFESEVWRPLAQEAARSGHPRKAWSAWFKLYPSGTGEDYDDVTVDIFSDWVSVWKPQGFSKEVVDKVFPGKAAEELMSPLPGLRNLVRRELYVVVDSAGGTSQ